MKAPWNFARFLPLAGRLLARGRLPTLRFAVASQGAAQGNRLGKLKDDLQFIFSRLKKSDELASILGTTKDNLNSQEI